MKTSAIITAEDKLNHLKTLFYRLRMRAAYERLTSILSDPDECGMSALDCIYEIMENEVQRRDSNALARRLKEAKICLPNARPDTIDFSIERGLDKNKIDALLTMRWMEEHQNIIITGAAGCGKTFLACALVNQACIKGRTARVVRVPLLLNQMAASHQIVETYFKKLKEMKTIDLLVLDDWGIGQLDARSRQDLLEIINERYMYASTIVTSVLPVNKWSEYINDTTYSDAILDRLVSVSHRVELNGASVRQMKKYGAVLKESERNIRLWFIRPLSTDLLKGLIKSVIN